MSDQLTLRSLQLKLQNIKTKNSAIASHEYAKTDGSEALEDLLNLPHPDYIHNISQLFQFGTNAPYENVLGGEFLGHYITWERMDVGVYRGTLEGAFPENKTLLIYSGVAVDPTADGMSNPPISPSFRYIAVERVDDDTILVSQFDDSLQPIDGLRGMYLEIRVYTDNTLMD